MVGNLSMMNMEVNVVHPTRDGEVVLVEEVAEDPAA